jgi:hypothetical protein
VTLTGVGQRALLAVACTSGRAENVTFHTRLVLLTDPCPPAASPFVGGVKSAAVPAPTVLAPIILMSVTGYLRRNSLAPRFPKIVLSDIIPPDGDTISRTGRFLKRALATTLAALLDSELIISSEVLFLQA